MSFDADIKKYQKQRAKAVERAEIANTEVAMLDSILAGFGAVPAKSSKRKNRGKITEKDEKKIRNWHKAGKKNNWIAKQLGVTPAAISTRLKKMGVSKAKKKKSTKKAKPAPVATVTA